MRVLHIITGLNAGGAEQQLRQLLRHLPAEVECDVVALTSPGAVADGLRADGARVRHLGMDGNRDFSALPRLTRLIRAGGYDVVHTHLYRACLYGRIAARLAGVRAVLASEHSLLDDSVEGRRATLGVRALYLLGERLGRVTVAVSPTVAGALQRWGVPASRIRVIPVGFDPDLFRFDEVRRKQARMYYGLPDDAFVVGAVGRQIPGKRFDVLVRALPHLPAETRLLLVGDGPEHAALGRNARDLGVADRVVLTGERPYLPDFRDGAPCIPDLLFAMDVLAGPSMAETYHMAVVEALASGLPVLYTTAPALSVLPPGSMPRALRVTGGAEEYARELLRLHAAGPGERTVPEVVWHNSIQNIARQTSRLYTEVLAGSTRK
ncbi:glycosyl transferase [Streptomyces sp. IMTB 2501]|uniref:glycosyltransferase n=1 Tax=Streptomyces sp. IMTB 2501 TaxID=1776340 RepID=UPI00096FE9C8|nr:glycosyltransferase [Streptomyces sp. IMTB 2501]OLZ65779.1 glycosyl transferase [Streptomyces sp. IMTB 2501]